jgi:uncharacterized protein YndB with AHSA1/START domain
MSITKPQPLIITRTINAPLSLVWKAHSEAEHLAQWWGPVGKKLLVKKLEFRPDGIFHYGMEAPDGGMWWGRFLYREIVPQQKLVYLSSFADEKADAARAPFPGNFPLLVENTLTFREQNGITLLRLQGLPYEASAAEQAFFEGMFDSMNGGFGATYDQLDSYLASLR